MCPLLFITEQNPIYLFNLMNTNLCISGFSFVMQFVTISNILNYKGEAL